MKRYIYMIAAFVLIGAASCQPDEEVAVHASFTTDKESYDVGDPVVLTNTSTAENALIAICKWELGKGVVRNHSGEHLLRPSRGVRHQADRHLRPRGEEVVVREDHSGRRQQHPARG